jgi:ubiquinone/menaquinone biosynthesis C-methylase UbiE
MAAENTKQVVGRYWDERAADFDQAFLHSVTTEGERQAWRRILDLLAGKGRTLDVLDAGCGTGFLALLFAESGHRVTGSDLAPEMIERARAKAREQGAPVTFLVDDAEALQHPDASFDLVVSRHLFWTLPHPERALAEWVRVVRPGGRVAVIDGQWDAVSERDGARRESPMRDAYGADVVAALPNFGGAPVERVAQMLAERGLREIRIDPLDDLVAAQRARMTDEQRSGSTYVRYAVFGDKP